MFSINRELNMDTILGSRNEKAFTLSKIEELRSEINEKIKLGNDAAFNDEMIKMSQYLDKLIVKYMSAQNGD